LKTYKYTRRKAYEAHIGNVTIGGDNRVAVQSMTNTPTMDTDASVAQILDIAAAGADIVRLTAQTPAHARNLGAIRAKVRQAGCNVPLVADIHFNPAAAFAAAEQVEKVRINPGNFVDPGRTFIKIEYTDEEYAAELQRIRDKFVPFLQLCREHGTAVRIGVNHGSLSDRIMSRYGDTPEGMVESAMEFLRVCVEENFTDVVISIKASNVVVMTRTVRLLAATMEREGMAFPLHLGVTEAGDGEDARVKSAVGIGSLLADGIGDTIRVSLAEDPVAEIPVARMLLNHVATIAGTDAPDGVRPERQLPPTSVVPQVIGRDGDATPAGAAEIHVAHPGALAKARKALDALDNPVNAVLTIDYPADMTADQVIIAASVDLGSILLEHPLQGVCINAPQMSRNRLNDLALSILQATRRRMSKTEFIACPSCGRTLFDLQSVLARVKAELGHLTHLKIGVMGCIVNGPGEMADADYGYVGAGPGRVSLYRNKTCIVKNIPADEAMPRLIELIKADGNWHEK
jgi:(E)-4-hydroxy-3-methylbut-2-enyl-diphosphate synthase